MSSWPVRHDDRRSDLPPCLATASVGDRVRVERIQLRAVAAMCRRRGISVGDRFAVVGRTDRSVFLRDGEGPPLRLPVPYAYYVCVDRRDGQLPVGERTEASAPRRKARRYPLRRSPGNGSDERERSEFPSGE